MSGPRKAGIMFKCPNGHDVPTPADNGTPVCETCELVATHYNGQTHEVYSWTPRGEYEANCQRLQDAMDDAFDNTYFNDW